MMSILNSVKHTIGVSAMIRPTENPDRLTGRNAGRKQRKKDQERGTYPREDLPLGRTDRPIQYISGYQSGYYQQHSRPGQPNHGTEPKITISVSVDRALWQTVVDHGVKPSTAAELGLQIYADGFWKSELSLIIRGEEE